MNLDSTLAVTKTCPKDGVHLSDPRVSRTNTRWHMGLIRFGGHLPKGEYDVDHDGHEGQADAAELHG